MVLINGPELWCIDTNFRYYLNKQDKNELLTYKPKNENEYKEMTEEDYKKEYPSTTSEQVTEKDSTGQNITSTKKIK
jgi:hypothetical protein